MATIITKNSQTASAVPSAASLEIGELAVNTADGKLYTEHTGGVVKQVGGNTQTISAGTGISVTNPSSTNPTVTNTGVTSVTAGSGISVSASTGGVTISASGGGVTSLNGQTGAITNTDYGAIGSYVLAFDSSMSGGNGTLYDVGRTVSGSSLNRDSQAVATAQPYALNSLNGIDRTESLTSLGLSGTWRQMTRAQLNADIASYGRLYPKSLYVRIS